MTCFIHYLIQKMNENYEPLNLEHELMEFPQIFIDYTNHLLYMIDDHGKLSKLTDKPVNGFRINEISPPYTIDVLYN